MGNTSESVVLRNERDNFDIRYLSASITKNGNLLIEGHDLGSKVKEILGFSEYEWSLTIQASEVPILLKALRTKRKVLHALKDSFSNENADNLEVFLKEHGISYEFWNRYGD
jgi:hypothetical protein